jgi:hypothetical protein
MNAGTKTGAEIMSLTIVKILKFYQSSIYNLQFSIYKSLRITQKVARFDEI